MAMTDFTVIGRSLTSRAFSTVVTILMVATAVGRNVGALLSMRDSSRRAFQRGSGNMHLLVSRDASPLGGGARRHLSRQPAEAADPLEQVRADRRLIPVGVCDPRSARRQLPRVPGPGHDRGGVLEQYQPDVGVPVGVSARAASTASRSRSSSAPKPPRPPDCTTGRSGLPGPRPRPHERPAGRRIGEP